MGLNIVLEGENATPVAEVSDPKGLLYQVLPSVDDESYYCLRFIDPYGDTVFNRPQMLAFVGEWQRVHNNVADLETKRVMQEVLQLALRCRDEVHLYLRFQGE